MRIKIRNKFQDFVQEFEKDHLSEGTKFDTKFQTIRKRLYRFVSVLFCIDSFFYSWAGSINQSKSEAS